MPAPARWLTDRLLSGREIGHKAGAILGIVPLALRYLGHRCTEDSAIKPWYFAGALKLQAGAVFAVPAGGLLLGRSPQADVRVASNGVARWHVRVAPAAGGGLVAEDLRSTNGTALNGAALTGPTTLGVGDVLTLAGYFDFEVIEAE